MKRNEQEAAFSCDLDALIHRYANEFDVNALFVIGALDDAKLRILMKLHKVAFEPEEE